MKNKPNVKKLIIIQLYGGKLKEVKAPKINKNNNSKYNFFFNLINFFYN